MAAQWRGERLKSAREELGLSQGRFARQVKAHPTSVSDWERDVNHPSARHLASICDLTGKQPSFFFGLDTAEEDAVGQALTSSVRAFVRHELERTN